MTFGITAHYNRYTGCRYVKCLDYLNIMLRVLSVIMLNVIMLNVVMLNVVMLSVVAPFKITLSNLTTLEMKIGRKKVS